MPAVEPRIAIVIPYYQTARGILTRALASVAAQSVQDVQVIIVDDDSPLDPSRDVAACPLLADRVTVIRQSNAGPGAARNAALDRVAPNAEFIAFLDSDDEWAPEHLANGLAALGRGFDFYFSDYTWPGRSSTRFAETNLLSSAKRICESPPLYTLEEDFAELVLSQWPVHVSATIIRADKLGGVRFDVRLRRSSEDQMYFISCALRASRVCFGGQVTLFLNDGANMFRNQGPGTEAFARTRIANAYFHRLLAHELPSQTEAFVRMNNKLIGANASAFCRSELKSLLAAGKINWRLWGPAARTLLVPGRPPKTSPV